MIRTLVKVLGFFFFVIAKNKMISEGVPKIISWKDKLIDQLRAEKQKFEDLYYKFRGFWHDNIKRFQGMIGFYHDESYKKVAKDLYEHEVFDMHEYETVLDVSRKIKTTEELQKTTKNRNDKVR